MESAGRSLVDRKPGWGAEREGGATVCKPSLGKQCTAGVGCGRHSSRLGQETSHRWRGTAREPSVWVQWCGGREQPCSAELSSGLRLQPARAWPLALAWLLGQRLSGGYPAGSGPGAGRSPLNQGGQASVQPCHLWGFRCCCCGKGG